MKLSEMIIAEVRRRADLIDGYENLMSIRIIVVKDREGRYWMRLQPEQNIGKIGATTE